MSKTTKKRRIQFAMCCTLVVSLLCIVTTTEALNTPAREMVKKTAIGAKQFAVAVDESSPNLAPPGSGSGDGVYLGVSSSALAAHCVPSSIDPNKGITLSCTFWDHQKNGTMGRQIVVDETFHIVNYVWTMQDNNLLSGGRNVRYEAYDPASGITSGGTGGVDVGADLIPPNRSGFATMELNPNGTVCVAFHWSRTFPGDPFEPYLFKNQTPSLGDFSGLGGVSGSGKVPPAIWTPFNTDPGDQWVWPQIARTATGSVNHMVLHNSNPDSHEYLYTRQIAGVWQPGFVFGTGGYISPTVVASRISQKVAICWTGGRGDATLNNCSISRTDGTIAGQSDNDLYYMMSTDGGATWGACQNITLRPDDLPGGFAPAARLTALFDANDDFHIVWDAMQWNGYDGPFTYISKLFHWDDLSATIRVAASGVWNPEVCNGGVFNLNVTQPQLSECDAKLYLSFVQFAPIGSNRGDDCSNRAAIDPTGAANGDIYLTISVTNGFNWDPPRNLTDSYNPDCDPTTDCHSNAWVSATRYGIDIFGDDFSGLTDLTDKIDVAYSADNFLFVEYVEDLDPGSAVRAEGNWSDNPVRAFRFGCVEPTAGALLCSSVPAGQVTTDTLKIKPGSSQEIKLTLSNVGNTFLTYSVSINNDDPTGNLAISGITGLIGSGLVNEETITITLNAGLLSVPQLAHAELEVFGNFQNSPKIFIFDYSICDISQQDVNTLAGSLVFNNRGNIGMTGNMGKGGLNMGFQSTYPALECNRFANTYLFDGSPIISYPGNGSAITASAMYACCYDIDTTQFRPVTATTVDIVSDPIWILGSSGEFETYDGKLGMETEYWVHKIPILPPENKVIFARVSYWNKTGSTINSVYCGAAWDWDVPSDEAALINVSNTSLISAPGLDYMVIEGEETVAGVDEPNCLDNSTRFAMTKYYKPLLIPGLGPFVSGGGTGVAALQSMYTGANSPIIAADWDYAQLGADMVSTTGFSAFAGAEDVHQIMNGGAYSLQPGDKVYLYYSMVTGFTPPPPSPAKAVETDYEAIDAIITAALPWGSSVCCETAGNANDDPLNKVNIADVTFLIARIFAGGDAPPCCAQGDANGNGKVNIADITFLIARIFAGGDAPVCGPVDTEC